MASWEDYGAGLSAVLMGLAALVGAILRPTWNLLRRQRNDTEPPPSPLGPIDLLIRDLHHWHAPDHAGEQSWKGHDISASLERIAREQDLQFRELGNLQDRQMELLREIATILKQRR